MNIRHIETFVAVVDKGSFSKAAQDLFTTPSALTQQVNTLERALGFPLLVRDYRGATPTPAGEVFYEKAKEILRLVEEAQNASREVAVSASGVIRLGSYRNIELVLLKRLIAGFANIFPDIRVVPIGGDYRGFFDQLRRDELDLFVRPWGSELDQPGVGFQKIGTTQLSICMAPDHPLAKHDKLVPADLAGYDLIVGCGCSSHMLDGLAARLSAEEKNVRIHQFTTDDEVWTHVLTQGYLHMNMDYAAKYLGASTSVILDIDDVYDYGFVYRTPAHASIQRFLDYAKAHPDLIGA